MEKVIGDFSTVVNMTAQEAKNVCRLGKGEEVCAFLVVGAEGFQCGRMMPLMSAGIFHRLEAGTMNAKGEGGWEGCAWEDELKTEED